MLELLLRELHHLFVLLFDVVVEIRNLLFYMLALLFFIANVVAHFFGDKEALVRVMNEFEEVAESILEEGNLYDFFFVASGDPSLVNLTKSVACDGNESVEEHDNVNNRRKKENDPLEILIFAEDVIEFANRSQIGHPDCCHIVLKESFVEALVCVHWIWLRLSSCCSSGVFF